MSVIRALLIAAVCAILFPVGSLHAQDLGDTDPWPALNVERAAIAQRLNVPTDVYEATSARLEADRAMSSRDWNNAALAYERAIAADGPWAVGDTRTWLRLGEARIAIGQYVETLGAATAARALSNSAPDRAHAWALVGRSLDRLNERDAAAQAFELSLAEQADPSVQRHYDGLQRRMRFALDGRDLNTDGDEAELCLQFSAPLRGSDSVDYDDYVAVDPRIDLSMRVNQSTLCLAGLSYGALYTVSVREGLPATDGRRLGEDVVVEVAVPDREPLIGFRTSAYVLPRIGSTGVPLTTVNVDEANLTLLRINDRNLVQQIRDGYMFRLFTTYDRDYVMSDLGEEVWSGTVEIASVPNERVVTAVPVQDMIEAIEPGVYVMMAEASNRALPYWEDRATQWLIVSDIGITTYHGADGLTVLVRSLDTAQPMQGVTLQLIARNNEPLGSVTTSNDGIARFAPGLMRGEQGLAPMMLTASDNGSDFSYLDLSAPAFDLSDRGVGGRSVVGPYDAFLYTDRGVYRPGETVQLVALLRDLAGEALTGLPLFIDLVRPDGSIVRTVGAQSEVLGGYHVPLDFSTATQTGRWQAFAYVDPDGDPVGSVEFLIEDVIPAQIEVSLSASASILSESGTVEVAADARYLYGAPGADLDVQAELVVERDPDPFPEFPGYHFGLADESLEPVRIALEAPATDDAGSSIIPVVAEGLPDTVNPLRATLFVSVLEPGGRAVSESLTLPIDDEASAIGISPRFADDEAPYATPAEFDVILVDTATRAKVSSAGLRYELVREDWRYRWYYRYGVWDYQVTVNDVPQGAGIIEADDASAGLVTLSLDWGHYRLEVFDPATGIAASYRFSAGWYGRPGDGDTPDTLQVELDADSYRPGDTAHAYVTAPFEGPVQLVLASDRILRSWTIVAGPDGAATEIPVDADWGAGAYLMATAFRPGNDLGRHGPGRAVGVAWLGIDAALHSLVVSIDAPELVEPRQRIEIPVTVSGLGQSKETYLTLAAVDEGILQLTDFTDPDPEIFYLGKRRLGVEIRDLYGRLLDGLSGQPGIIRSGGDSGAGRRGAPPQIKLVALFSGIVAVDAAGRAVIPLDLPDYNGRLRLMAVAWDAKRVGSASSPLIVRDPVVAIVSTSRFLAPGDRSQMTVTIQNLDGVAGQYSLAVSGDESVAVVDPAPQVFELGVGEATTLPVAIEGKAVGAGQFRLQVSGPADWQLERTISLGVRPAQLPTLDRVAYRLDAGESLTVGSDIAARFVTGSGEALVSFGGTPDLDVAGLLRSLDRYPYGCLEQTTSRAMPLLYVAEVAKTWGQSEDGDALGSRIDSAIVRVVDMQRWDGSFGMWSGYGYTDEWLSAYAMDFLTRARSFGYDVPDFAYQKGIGWMQERVGAYDERNPYNLAARTYAAYVLASAGIGDVTPLRYMFDTLPRDSGGQPISASPLMLAQLGAGLALFGELDRAQSAFVQAIAMTRGRPGGYYQDYGSPVRDLALTVALAAESGIASFDTVSAVERLIGLYTNRRYLSTQEEGALLLAAARIGVGGAFTLSIDGSVPERHTDALRVYRAGDDLARDITYRNAGDEPVWANVTVIGSPAQTMPRANEGITIERAYFDLRGNPIDPAQMTQGDVALVELAVTVEKDTVDQILVVDLLPAGLEAENPHLSDARNADEFGWLPVLADVEHAEYRDDRYMGAVSWNGRGEFSLAYLVRAVTPGEYTLPAPVAEAMYDPTIRGRGDVGRVTVSAAQ